jgi:enoyl-CoA hydratase/carnithine racemase
MCSFSRWRLPEMNILYECSLHGDVLSPQTWCAVGVLSYYSVPNGLFPQHFLYKQAEAAIAKLGAARKNDLVVSGKKAIKNAPQEEDSEDDDEEEDSEDDDSEDEAVDNEFIAKMIKRNGLAAPKSARVEELDAEEDDSEVSGRCCEEW